MFTSKLCIVIFSFTYLYLEVQSSNSRKDDFITTYETKRDKYTNILPVNVEEKLYYITASNNTLILTSIETDNEICKISYNGSFRLGRKPPHVFGNGKIIAFSESNYQFLIVNPKTCIVDKVGKIENKKSVRSPNDSPIGIIITYHDSFDVFDLKFDYCAPCRFNDNGEEIKIPYKIDVKVTDTDPKTNMIFYGLTMNHVKNFASLSEGYILISQVSQTSAVIKLLNMKFEVMKERQFEHYIADHSTDFNGLSLCYAPNECAPRKFESKCLKITCELLDENLKTKSTVKLHDYIENHEEFYGIYPKIHNLPEGGAVALLNYKYVPEVDNKHDKNQYKTNDIYIQHIKNDGELDIPVKYNDFVHEHVNLNSFVTKNGRYCVTGVYNEEIYESVRTRCTAPLTGH